MAITKLVSEAVAARGLVTLVGRILAGIYVALIVAIAGLLLIRGGQIREGLDIDRARAVAEDDRSFCIRFGMEPGTARYAECTAALVDVRSRHDQRRADLFF